MLVYQASAREDWDGIILLKHSFSDSYDPEKAKKDAGYIVDMLIHCLPNETLDEIAPLLESELHARKWRDKEESDES